MRSALRNRSPLETRTGSRGPALPGWGRSGKTRELEAMSAVGTLFTIVNGTSNGTSQVNWHLYRKNVTSGVAASRTERVEVTSHLALDVLNKPATNFTRQELVEATQQHIDLTGEGYWVVEKDEMFGWPAGMVYVRPDRMAPAGDGFTPTGWVYTSPDGYKVPLDTDEVIQFRLPNPMDPMRGLGPVQAILTDIESAQLAALWNRNFFQNDASPGGLIEVDHRLDDNEFDEFTLRWNEGHRGVAKAHRVALLEGGMKWVDRSYSPKDMQFSEMRQVSRDFIREAFGVTKFDVGDIDDVNRATAEASEMRWAKRIIVPRLERFKGGLNNDFLPMFGPTGAGVEFDYDCPVPDDREANNAELAARAAAAASLVSAGYDRSDVLTTVGLPDMRPALTGAAQ